MFTKSMLTLSAPFKNYKRASSGWGVEFHNSFVWFNITKRNTYIFLERPLE